MGCNYPGFRWIIISPLKNDPRFAWKFCQYVARLFGIMMWFWHYMLARFPLQYCIPRLLLHSNRMASNGWHANFTLSSHTAYPQKNEETNVDSVTFWGDGERESTVDSVEQPLSPVVPAPAARCVRMTSGNPIHTRSMVDSNGINAVSNAMSQDLSKVGWSTNSTGDCSYVENKTIGLVLVWRTPFFWKTPCNTTCHMWHDMRIYEI